MTIRVGVDGSGPSRAALAWALSRADRLQEPVVLVHVVDEEGSEPSAGTRVLDEAVSSALTLLPDLELTPRLVHGSVAWDLAQGMAVDDLIVVGTHKTGYLRGRVSGTRSIVVASMSPGSIAVIPDINLSGRSRVVIGIAESGALPDAVGVGANEAARTGQELALIHAIPDHPNAASQGRQLLTTASTLAAERAPGTVIRRRISQQRPANALLDASQASSLLVLGMSRRDPSRPRVIGSVIHEVLLNINAPVFIAQESRQSTAG